MKQASIMQLPERQRLMDQALPTQILALLAQALIPRPLEQLRRCILQQALGALNPSEAPTPRPQEQLRRRISLQPPVALNPLQPPQVPLRRSRIVHVLMPMLDQQRRRGLSLLEGMLVRARTKFLLPIGLTPASPTPPKSSVRELISMAIMGITLALMLQRLVPVLEQVLWPPRKHTGTITDTAITSLEPEPLNQRQA